MGVAVLLIGCFLKSDWPNSTIPVAHQSVQQSQFNSAPEKPEDTVECRVPGEYAGARKHVSFAEFETELHDVDENDIFYEREADKICVTYRSSPNIGDLSMPVGIGGLNGWQFDPDKVGIDTVDSRVTALIEVFTNVATTIDPDVAFLMLFNDHGIGKAIVESREPDQHGLEALPFLMILSEPWIDYCGGRQHVLQTPVYDVSELSTGSIFLQVKQRPSADGCRYSQGFEHLLGEQ